jgi:predicted nucleic acid-binding protein
MTAVLLDSVVLLDVITRDPAWFDWSAAALAEAADGAGAVLNPIVYAEISAAFTDIEAVDAAVPPSIFRREQLPWEAAFLASKAYVAYRHRGGVRRSPLPDFYIGAHAAVAGYRLLTRDARRFRAYFPTIELIAP